MLNEELRDRVYRPALQCDDPDWACGHGELDRQNLELGALPPKRTKDVGGIAR
jgi:hypothetical protein